MARKMPKVQVDKKLSKAPAVKKPAAKTRAHKTSETKTFEICVPFADLRGDPESGAVITKEDSQLLFGEHFRAEKKSKEFYFGTSLIDGYNGWVHQSNLTAPKEKPTHAVTNLMAHIYPKPDFKTRPTAPLPFMSRLFVQLGIAQNGFVKVPGHGWVFKNHLTKISELKDNRDPLVAALKFLGKPYLYGGRSALGVDCSGLVQLALSYCALPCPRDTADQVKIGKPVAHGDEKRGDIVFFAGHVGILIDRDHILNATARTMDVRIERLTALAEIYKGITAVRRLG